MEILIKDGKAWRNPVHPRATCLLVSILEANGFPEIKGTENMSKKEFSAKQRSSISKKFCS